MTRSMKLLAVVLAVTMISFLTTSAHAPLAPSITLSPTSGPPGTSVTITGSHFFADDFDCTISSSPSGLISSPTCSLPPGSTVVSASFTVASGAAGTYTVTVTGENFGDSASGSFTVTTPPAPVGGVVEPVNKLSIIAPYLTLFALVAAVAVVIVKPWKKPEN